MAPSTVCQVINSTLPVLWKVLQPIVLSCPTFAEWQAISRQFDTRWNFPNLLGCIDGKHCVIQKPNLAGSEFYNYKGSHSINLMACCDGQYRFTLVSVGGFGSQNDSQTFTGSAFGQLILQNGLDTPKVGVLPGTQQEAPMVFVADEAFPLKCNLLRPYPGTALNQEKRIFNYRLSRARRCIENAFGILAARWRIFRKPIIADPVNADNIIKAALCLHNYLMDPVDKAARHLYCPISFADQEIDGTTTEGFWRQVICSDTGLVKAPRNYGSNYHSKVAMASRETFCAYVNSEVGSVPWQEEHVDKRLQRQCN
jgi:hypothetical protein